MPSATLTSKGQVTIPAEVRNKLSLNTGDRIDFVQMEGTNRYEVVAGTSPVQALRGIVPKPRKPVSISDMNEAIRKRSFYSR
jgi:AbrB family looped-hinge helix DNA binding protein